MECDATDSNYFCHTFYTDTDILFIFELYNYCIFAHFVYSEGATVGPELIGC